MMILVTNATHKRVPTMYRCLTTYLIPTHLPIASLTLAGHSHAHHLTKMGGCNPNDATHMMSHDYRPSWAHVTIIVNLLLWRL